MMQLAWQAVLTN